MITKKICLVGAFAVGKSALIQQYVHSIFSDKYLSTIGVKISKKQITVMGEDVSLILWDLEGKDPYVNINTSYLRGASGLFIVADGTRRETLDSAMQIRELALELLGPVPHFILINKIDLAEEWEITEDDIAKLQQQGIQIAKTSAKTNVGVNECFEALATAVL